jgi:hypothetical protein
MPAELDPADIGGRRIAFDIFLSCPNAVAGCYN